MKSFFALLILSLSLFFVFAKKTNAQEYEFGIRIEAIGQQTSSSDGSTNFGWYPIPNAMKLHFGISPIEKIFFELRGGKKFIWDNFIGYQLESFVRYKFNEKFYFVGGLTYHMNEAWQSNTSGSMQVNIIMPSLGVGIKLWKQSGFEVMAQKANGVIGSQRNDYATHSESFSTKLNWALKLGYFYAWSF